MPLHNAGSVDLQGDDAAAGMGAMETEGKRNVGEGGGGKMGYPATK